MRFAVRRPATRPVIPRGHRAPGSDVPALPAVPSGLADRDDRTGVSPSVRPWARRPAPGRRSLALSPAAPADADLAGPGPTDPYGDRGVPAAGTVSGRKALPGSVSSAELDRTGAYATVVPGTPVPAADLAALTGETTYAPVEAASPYAPEVLVPTSVLPGRREQTGRLGATTDRLLLHHLREGRARPDITRIPGRERRSLPGMQARALTPRGR